MLTEEHLGYELSYIEDDSKFVCRQLQLEAATLKALKEKVRQFDTSGRRLPDGLKAWHYSRYSAGPKPVLLQLMAENGKVWVVADASGEAINGKLARPKTLKREKVFFSELYAPTPEFEETIAKVDECERQAQAARQRAEQLRASLKCLTREQIDAMAKMIEGQDGLAD